MITAVLDTNVVVQSIISSPRSASVRVLDAYYYGRFRLVYSQATLDELLEVLLVPHIRERHGLTDDEILEFIASLLTNADRYADQRFISATVTRDLTDTKFVTLAEVSESGYLVTNDRRHLLPLKWHGRTKIVTPTQFLRQLR